MDDLGVPLFLETPISLPEKKGFAIANFKMRILIVRGSCENDTYIRGVAENICMCIYIYITWGSNLGCLKVKH